MGRIINTLRYGRAKTKTFIISVFVLMVAAIVLGIIGINRMNIIMLGISMVLFIICIIMVFRLEGVTKGVDPDSESESESKMSVDQRTGTTKASGNAEREGGERREKADDGVRLNRGEDGREKAVEEVRTDREEDRHRTAEEAADLRGEARRKAAQERLYSTLRGKSRGPKAIRANLEKKLLLEIIKANKRSAAVERKVLSKRMKEASKARRRKIGEMRSRTGERAVPTGTVRTAENARTSANRSPEAKRMRDDDREEKKNRDGEEKTKKSRDGDTSESGRPDNKGTEGKRERVSDGSVSAPERSTRSDNKTDYRTYTKNEFKRLRKVYKIPKNACRIVIDSCKSLAIDHAPALFWAKKGRFYILAFEETARCETLPMSNTAVSYKKNIREDEIIKYNAMREMGVYKEFEDMMPTFSIHGGSAGNEYFKNLYVVGKDLEITPRSLRSLMTQFDFKIHIFDNLGIKGNYSKYFRKAYEQRIMWTDGVISQNQYQNNIRDILQSMVDDDSIIRYDFMEDLGKMVHHRLITDEYAEFYKNKRL